MEQSLHNLLELGYDLEERYKLARAFRHPVYGERLRAAFTYQDYDTSIPQFSLMARVLWAYSKRSFPFLVKLVEHAPITVVMRDEEGLTTEQLIYKYGPIEKLLSERERQIVFNLYLAENKVLSSKELRILTGLDTDNFNKTMKKLVHKHIIINNIYILVSYIYCLLSLGRYANLIFPLIRALSQQSPKHPHYVLLESPALTRMCNKAFCALRDKPEERPHNYIEVWYNIPEFIRHELGQEVYEDGRPSYRVLCPLHGESTPSFYIHADEHWHCYGCGARGAMLWELYMKMHDCNPFEAMHGVFQYSNACEDTLSKPEHQQAEQEVDRYTRYKNGLQYLNHLLTVGDAYWQTFDHNNLTKAHGYMYSRGFSGPVLRDNHVYATYNYGETHPIFLVLHFNDEPLGYMQRAIDERIEPKYKTMSGMPKSRYVYGRIGPEKPVVLLCEGVTDVLMAMQYGYNDAVATLGATISEEQADILASHARAILCAYHDDEAGNLAYKHCVSLMQKRGVSCTRLYLPVKDIASATRDQFQKALKLVAQDDTF